MKKLDLFIVILSLGLLLVLSGCDIFRGDGGSTILQFKGKSKTLTLTFPENTAPSEPEFKSAVRIVP